MKVLIGFMMIAIACILWAVPVVRLVQFDRACEGHLGLAAVASSVETAIKELDIAIAYLEEERITSGHTSIFYNTPDEDIKFFYENLKAARKELATLPETATQLEKTNTLMKLRETLTSGGEHGEVLNTPAGISRYTYNGMILFMTLLGIVIAIMGAFLMAVGLNE